MKTNLKKINGKLDKNVKLAGGSGTYAAKQDSEALLRRSVLTALLWENVAYQTGSEVAEQICSLVPQVPAEEVASLAIEARVAQKLRHIPLLLVREMARYDSHKHLVGNLLPQVILRADEIAEFLAIYWKDGKCPISAQVKKGLAKAFNNFNAYNFAKYNRKNEITLRDVMFLTHPDPSQSKKELFEQIANNTLPTPDTWEVALSSGENKKDVFERLIKEEKLGAMAFLRNLRNMEEAKVDHNIIYNGFTKINPTWLLPLDYLKAAKYAPRWINEIETLMFRGLEKAPKLKGHSVFVVDVSGSMGNSLSSKSDFSRVDAAIAMAVLAREMCERVTIYATAGSDSRSTHKTQIIPAHRGFALQETVLKEYYNLGGGGIFTRQCLEYISEDLAGTPVDRILIFSDSQDCDRNKKLPKPFGVYNYIIDVSANSRGINYDGIWTAEISGWSEHFLKFIAALEENLKGK